VLNRVRRDTSVSSIVVRLLVSTVAVTAVLLLVLLAAASANTEFFDRYYQWLYTANIAVALIFMGIVAVLVVVIISRLRKGKFGTRLLAKLAFFFALVGVVPGGIIYIVSYQFVSRSIESWFDVNVETALTSGLSLGRGMLDASLSDLQTKGRLMAEQLANADSAGTTLTLLRLRDQFGVQDATIVEPVRSMSGASPDMHVVAQATGNYASLVPTDLPTPLMIEQARGRGFAAIEGEVDGDPREHGSKGALRLRIVQRIPDTNSTQLQPTDRFLQLTQPVSASLARNADAVQRAYREYQEKALGRTGLRKMYIGTLTLALFLATFIAMMLALALGNQLARPLFLLAQGTKEVTEGDYTPKREIKSRDELGFLTQSFNAMTRQLSEARAAVENNRIALEHSKAYLESILANLTAGVFVFDRQFRLTTANRGAERIFRQPFQASLGSALDRITVLSEFGGMVRKAFADRRGPLAAAVLDADGRRSRPADAAGARRATGCGHLDGGFGGRADRGLRGRLRRHLRRDLRAAFGRMGRSCAAPRARDQEPAYAYPAIGRALADEAVGQARPIRCRCAEARRDDHRESGRGDEADGRRLPRLRAHTARGAGEPAA
jgi:nitrogen fixation/metabolism regulation signal transduction histidine kinase